MDANLAKSIIADCLPIVLDEYKAPEQKEPAVQAILKVIAPHYLRLEEDLKKARDFKTYVHTYLDDQGIPHHPYLNRDVTNNCRIGHRFEWLFAKLQHLEGNMKELKCFSCGVQWSWENHADRCDMAHREEWGHEWVSQRVIDLTNKAAQLMQLLEQLTQTANSWRSQSEGGVSGFPSRKLALIGCASTIETMVKAYKGKGSNAESDRRVATPSG